MAQIISISNQFNNSLGSCWLCKLEDDYSGELMDKCLYPQSDYSAAEALDAFICNYVPDEDDVDGIYIWDEAKNDAEAMTRALTYHARYGIEYRSMHTAIHHVLVFGDRETALFRDGEFEEERLGNGGEITDEMVADLFDSAVSDEEIDFRQVEDVALPDGSFWRYFDDGGYGIYIANLVSYDFYV